MDNSFKNKIESLDKFELEPSSKVWSAIEKELPEEKKRRIIGWWWSIPAIGFIALISSLLLLDKSSKTTSQNYSDFVIENNKAKNEESGYVKNEENTIKENEIIKEKSIETKDKKIESCLRSESGIAENFNNALVEQNTENYISSFQNKISKNETRLNKNLAATIEETETLNNEYLDTSFKKSYDLNTTEINQNKTNISETLVYEKIINNAVQATDSSSMNSANELKKCNQRKELELSFTINFGSNNCKENTLFTRKSSAATTSGLSSPSGALSGLGSNNYLMRPDNGFTLGFGVHASKFISKKSKLNFGINYSYVQNNTTVIPASQNNTFFANDSISNTNKIDFNNYQHIVQIPIQYQLYINKKIFLITGISAEYSIKRNYLFLNYSTSNFENNNENISKFHASALLGLGIEFMNKSSISILTKQYLTSVQNQDPKYYWQQTLLQYSLPLNKIKNKK